ncbi:MAG: ribbon-helix-helix protein, CopG family [Verrucomicrobiota bacterium]
MSYTTSLVRTSVSLDTGTLGVLDELAKRWSVSKAEVMRRSIRKLKEDADAEDMRPSPLQALEWLQSGAGVSMAEGEDFKAKIGAERQAKRYWWES